jgi:hypothetical protein
MSITKILSEKDVAAEVKLEAVVEVIAKVRETYGNSDVKFEAPMVNTVHGQMPFDMLEAESQVEVLKSQAGFVKAKAVEYVTTNTGAVLNRKVEELLATNPFFATISSGAKYDYL